VPNWMPRNLDRRVEALAPWMIPRLRAPAGALCEAISTATATARDMPEATAASNNANGGEAHKCPADLNQELAERRLLARMA